MTEEQKQRCIKEANAATFHGKSVSEMSREELLVMIGFIGKSYARWKEESSNLNSLHLS